MTPSDLQPTVDAFRALARSSPWRWRTLHFRHRDHDGEVEAWLRRPGRLTVRTEDGKLHHQTTEPTAAMVSTVSFSTDAGLELPLPPIPDPVTPDQVTPTYRPDGLVAVRPDGLHIDYDDPMWVNYVWVAMLDPVELSHDVRIEELREDELAGRRVWRARLVAEAGYDPRCGGNCCELLFSESGLLADFADDPSQIPEEWRGRRYPDAYDAALDVQTGIVVRLHSVGGDDDAPWLENDILEVDADLDPS